MSTEEMAMHIIIIDKTSVDAVFITFAYRIVAVAAEAKGKTYAQYSPITDGIWNKVGPIPNKRIKSMSTQPSNISAKNSISISWCCYEKKHTRRSFQPTIFMKSSKDEEDTIYVEKESGSKAHG